MSTFAESSSANAVHRPFIDDLLACHGTIDARPGKSKAEVGELIREWPGWVHINGNRGIFDLADHVFHVHVLSRLFHDLAGFLERGVRAGIESPQQSLLLRQAPVA